MAARLETADSRNNSLEQCVIPELQDLDPQVFYDFLRTNWKDRIHLEVASPGEKIRKIVHGEEKEGDYFVSVGDLLTRYAGTKLTAGSFIPWLKDDGFVIENGNDQELPFQDAIDLLESSQLAKDRNPIVRLRRPAENGGLATCFEFYSGSQSEPIRTLSRLGNRSKITSEEKEEYRENVSTLLGLFSARGTTKLKPKLHIASETPKERNVDDCFASLITAIGWMEIKNHLKVSQPETLLELDASVGTTQALVTAMVLAEYGKRHLLVRIGAPTFGLGNKKMGLNYMMNTQQDMLKLGPMTTGDLGKNMSRGKEQFMKPFIAPIGDGNPSYETVLFLGGGWPLFEMLFVHYFNYRKKEMNGLITIVRASRMDDENDWGALFTIPKHEYLKKMEELQNNTRRFLS